MSTQVDLEEQVSRGQAVLQSLSAGGDMNADMNELAEQLNEEMGDDNEDGDEEGEDGEDGKKKSGPKVTVSKKIFQERVRGIVFKDWNRFKKIVERENDEAARKAKARSTWFQLMRTYLLLMIYVLILLFASTVTDYTAVASQSCYTPDRAHPDISAASTYQAKVELVRLLGQATVACGILAVFFLFFLWRCCPLSKILRYLLMFVSLMALAVVIAATATYSESEIVAALKADLATKYPDYQVYGPDCFVVLENFDVQAKLFGLVTGAAVAIATAWGAFYLRMFTCTQKCVDSCSGEDSEAGQ